MSTQRTRQRVIELIDRGNFNVTGVLSFKDGRRMPPAKAAAIFKSFHHKVDRVFFGRAADKGVGVNRMCFLELSESGSNLHLHFVAQSVGDPTAFCVILNILWHKFNDANASLQKNWITPIESKIRTADYVTKEIRFERTETIGADCGHSNETGVDCDDYDNEAMTNRIANQVTQPLIEEAYDAFLIHVDETRERMARCDKKRQQAEELIATRIRNIGENTRSHIMAK